MMTLSTIQLDQVSRGTRGEDALPADGPVLGIELAMPARPLGPLPDGELGIVLWTLVVSLVAGFAVVGLVMLSRSSRLSRLVDGRGGHAVLCRRCVANRTIEIAIG